jgi:hypothetical protein
MPVYKIQLFQSFFQAKLSTIIIVLNKNMFAFFFIYVFHKQN